MKSPKSRPVITSRICPSTGGVSFFLINSPKSKVQIDSVEALARFSADNVTCDFTFGAYQILAGHLLGRKLLPGLDFPVENGESSGAQVPGGSKPVRSTKIKKDVYGEYRVKLFIDGKHDLEADYFTDDFEDAKITALAMERAFA